MTQVGYYCNVVSRIEHKYNTKTTFNFIRKLAKWNTTLFSIFGSMDIIAKGKKYQDISKYYQNPVPEFFRLFVITLRILNQNSLYFIQF